MSANETELDSRVQSSDTVHVALGARSYDIVVGGGLLAHAGDHIAPHLAVPHCVLISDENVAPHYLDRVLASLSGGGIACDKINHATTIKVAQ